ncbi:hypothetical protein ACET3Z_008029 [Daucus carota]
MHHDISDSANHVTNYMGTGYILAIIVAYLTDGHLGRYKAVILSLSIEFLALGLLTIQAHYPKLKPPPCNIFDPTTKCEVVDGKNSVILFAGTYALALGAAGVKASLPTHGADQFDEKDPKEAKQMSSFFNWLLLALCIGAAVSSTLIVWIQDYKGWDKGFGISALAVLVGIIVFSGGFPRYRVHVTRGTGAMTEIIQVYVAAVRNRKLKYPDNDAELYELQTFSIQQGTTMDTTITKSFNIPPASLPIFPVASLIILIPIYDVFFVPFAPAILEAKRKRVARDNNMLDAIPTLQPLPINVFWIMIQYFIFGIADMFTYVGLLEFFYSEAPKGLKSISTCFLWSSMALGYYLSTILVQILNAVTKNITASGGWLAGNNINRNHLNLFYWLLSLMSLINFIVYQFVAKNYKYRSHGPSDEVDNKVREVNDLEEADVERSSQ